MGCLSDNNCLSYNINDNRRITNKDKVKESQNIENKNNQNIETSGESTIDTTLKEILNSKNYIIKSSFKKYNSKVYQLEDKNNHENQRYLTIEEIPNKKENENFLLESLKGNKNITNIKESFFCENKLCIITESEKKQSLRDLINSYKDKLIDENLILLILRDICLGLKFLNSKNFNKFNLNPDNIFIIDESDIKIGLFVNKDNYHYWAPEEFQSNISLDKKDIFSLGCILYELCQKEIFNDCNKEDKNECYENIKKKVKNIKLNNKYKNLNNLIKKLLAIDINDRYNINEVYKEMKKLLLNLKKIENNEKLDEISKKVLKRLHKNEIEITLNTKNNQEESKIFKIEDNKIKIKKNLNYTKIYIDNVKIDKQNNNEYILGEENEKTILLEFDNSFIDWKECFRDCKSIVNIDLYLFDNSNAKDMSSMFNHCINLKRVNLYSYENIKLENINNMFYDCENLEELDLSLSKSEKLKTMQKLFQNCMNLKKIKFLTKSSKNIVDMSHLFDNCISLINLDLSSFDTSNVKNLDSMFVNCKSIEKLDLSNFDTKNLTNIQNIFKGCEKLKILDISYFNTDKVQDIIEQIFDGCKNLKKIIINNCVKKNGKKEKEKITKIIKKDNKMKCNIIDLKLTLAYKSFIDLFIYFFKLDDKMDLMNKKRNISIFLFKKKSKYALEINELLEDLLEFIDNYRYDEFEIDFEKNIIEQIITNIIEYKGNEQYRKIKEIINEDCEKLFKGLIEKREKKEEEQTIIEKLKLIDLNI